MSFKENHALLLHESENGSLRAELRLRRASAGRVEFGLEIVNAASEPVLVTVYGIARNGTEVPVEPYSQWIDGGADASVPLVFAGMAVWNLRGVAVRLQGKSVHQVLDAAMPRVSSPLWFAGGVIATLAVVALVALLRPHDGPVPQAVPTPIATASAVPAPRIKSFVLDRATVKDGGSVVARYSISGDSGDLLAVDAQGTIWAQAATHGNGETQLMLPRFGTEKELQVRLVVRRGTQLAAAGIGLQVVP